MDAFITASVPQFSGSACRQLTVVAMGQGERSQKRTHRLHRILALVAVLMFGFAFALVPLYDTLCRVLGINGKIEQADSGVANVSVETSEPREIRIEFVTTNNERLNWSFYPLVSALKVQPSEAYTIQFYAKNKTDRPMTVQAIPNVTPAQGAAYLRKTECFCFEKQTLQSGESMKMPVVFTVDPDLPKKYKTLTLSYTLFDTERRRKVH